MSYKHKLDYARRLYTEKICPRIRVSQLTLYFLLIMSVFFLAKFGQLITQQTSLLQQQNNLLQQQENSFQRQENLFQQQVELLQRQSNLLHQQINPSHQHILIRQFMVNSHLAQMDEDRVLIIGDSIVEGWLNEEIGQCKTLNVGFGSGTVLDILNFLDTAHAKVESGKINSEIIKSIVLMIGVNDAKRRDNLPDDYVEAWSRDYEKLIDKALELSSGRVLISTILPVERNMPLGDLYFDPALIEDFNALIRIIAKNKNIDLVDANEYFNNHFRQNSVSFTVDGVHLNAEGYKILDFIIAPNLELCSPVN